MRVKPDAPGPSAAKVIRWSISTSGFRSLYTGLSASLLRQMSYSLVRLGAYEALKVRMSESGRPSTLKLLLAAAVVGVYSHVIASALTLQSDWWPGRYCRESGW